MHLVLPLAPILYVGALFWVWFRVATSQRTLDALSYPRAVIFPVVGGLIALEVGYTLVVSPRIGSSRYHPLFPDLMAGSLLAVGTLALGKEHLRFRVGRLTIVSIAWLWLIGALVVDLLWFTERTNRGVGWLWHYPVVSSLVAGAAYLLMFVGSVTDFCVNPPFISGAGQIAQFAWWLVLAVLSVWLLSKLSGHRAKTASFLVVSSCTFLIAKLIEWRDFIAD